MNKPFFHLFGLLLLGLSFLGHSSRLYASPALILTNQEQVSLTPFVSYAWSEVQAIEQGLLLDYQPPQEKSLLNFGFRTTPLWLRFTLENPSTKTITRYVNIEYAPP
ncbi:MAG: 7TM-DISM domain-containing protein [bacterium]|nr:7TM-DISM domain-containing protein [bacterium]